MSDFFTRIGATAIAQNTSQYFYMPDMATLAIDTSAVSSGTYKVYAAQDYNPAMVDPSSAHWVPIATVDSAGTRVAANSAVTPSTTKTVYGSVAAYTGIKITEQNAGTVSVMVAGSKSPLTDILAGVSGSITADTELTTADLDTGAGTDTRAVVGIVGSKSGGGVLIPGDATAGLKVDLGADNDVIVTSGSITATIIHGKTLKTYSATISADTDVIAAVSSKRIKVFAYSIINIDNTADTVIFKSNGTGGTELWRVYLRGPDANTPYGANLATACPSFLFATVAGEKLTVDVSAAATLHISIAYWDDDAS